MGDGQLAVRAASGKLTPGDGQATGSGASADNRMARDTHSPLTEGLAHQLTIT